MRKILLSVVLTLTVLLAGCKGEKRMAAYQDFYREHPAVMYVAPVTDLAMRRAVREPADSAYNASISIAAQQLYLTASEPLVRMGYYLPGPMMSAQLAATERRTMKQLRNEDISDLQRDLGIDAVLFITLHSWKQQGSSWTAYVEYVLRSTASGNELAHFWVTAVKELPTDFKGNPKPLKADIEFAEATGYDLETAQRCRLVEVTNQYVLRDLPTGQRARAYDAERHLKSHPEYFTLVIDRGGNVGLLGALDVNLDDFQDGLSF